MWAKMEADAANHKAAREMFSVALRLDPSMPHSYCAWARMEASSGNVERAREVFQEGTEAVPGHAPLLHVSPPLGKE